MWAKPQARKMAKTLSIKKFQNEKIHRKRPNNTNEVNQLTCLKCAIHLGQVVFQQEKKKKNMSGFFISLLIFHRHTSSMRPWWPHALLAL